MMDLEELKRKLIYGVNASYEGHEAMSEAASAIESLQAKVAELEKRPEPLSWESMTKGYIKYVTDSRYKKFSRDVQKWYRPLCHKCAIPNPE